MHPTQAEKNTFGEDVKLHPVTHMPLEQGLGHLPDDVQAANHCNTIEAEGDKPRADAMRKKLGIRTTEELAAEAAARAEQHKKMVADAARVPTLEARIAELEAEVAALLPHQPEPAAETGAAEIASADDHHEEH